jgi:hypothetical protein
MVKATIFPGNLQTRLLIVLIASVVFVCYLPALNNGFVWDDNHNLVENFNYRGLSSSHLYWMFTTFHDANYHPLAWLTLGFDFVLWGMNPAGYHLTNIVLHVINSVLFYFLIVVFIRQTNIASNTGLAGVQVGAVFGALFFAIHPLRVETVAWISTRGDLLCGVFYILTIIAYVRMSDIEAYNDRRKWFLLALLFFMFSLLSRAWGMTIPLVLIILDVYPLRRFVFASLSTSSFKQTLIEKIPFLLLALGAAIFAIQAKEGPMLMVAEHGIIDRLMQAAYGLYFYIFKTVMPIKLSPFYLLGKAFNPMETKYVLSALAVLGITLGLTVMRRRWPWALTAWVCYAVIVSPLLGFVQSGPQIAADRYTYIACMPFAVLAGAGAYRLWLAWQKASLSWPVFISVITMISAVLIVLFFISFGQTGIWRDNYTFWNYVIKLDPGNYIAYNNRGVLLKEQEGDLIKVQEDYNKAIELYPGHEGAYYNRGLLHEQQGDLVGAIADYSSVIRLDPRHAKAYNNRGALRKAQGDLDGAMEDFDTAIRLAPFSPEAYANRGMIHLSKNDLQRAFDDFTKVLEVASVAWPHRVVIEQLHISLRKRLEATD